MISGINSTLSALRGLSTKLDSTANNVANMESDGFKKTRVTLEEGGAAGGVSARVERVETPGPQVLETTPAGTTLVEKSNVELTEEIPNLMMVKNSYKANLKVIQVNDEMLGSLLDIKG